MYTKQIKEGVTKTFENLKVNKIGSTIVNGKERFWASVSQITTTTYPAQQMSNEFSSALFSAPEGQKFESKPKFAIVPLPSLLSNEVVQKQLDTWKEGTIYSIVTNNIDDLLSKNDIWAIENELTTKENLKNKYETQDKSGVKYSGGQIYDGSLPREYTRRFAFNGIKEDIIKVIYTKTPANVEFVEADKITIGEPV